MIAPDTQEQAPVTWDFTQEKACYDKVIADFEEEKRKVKLRRDLRENRKNVEEERKKGTILNDETIIPDRTINTNIKRGKASYLAYITQAKRMLIITELSRPALSIDSLELWFTRGMRYPKWKMPWMRAIDAQHLHGGAAMEVMYDPSKPLNVTVEYIPRDSLLFPRKTKNLQACPRILRAYEITTLQLEEYTKQYGFSEYVSKEILDKYRKNEDFITIYRGLCKKDGQVYNFWYSKDCNQNDWLRAPQLHEVGLFDFDPAILMQPDVATGTPVFMSPTWAQPVLDPMTGQPAMDPMTGQLIPSLREQLMVPLALKEYPIYWIPYEITENEALLEGQGRAALDLHVQEALTHVVTNTINATTRASHVYGSAENIDAMDSGMAELGPIKPGRIMSRKINLFQPPWPSNIILAVTQALRIDKANEAGQTDYAAMARKDANKTATEMELATEQAQTVVTTEMDIFSSPVLDIFALQFKIASHQAIFGLCTPPPDPSLLLGDYNLVPAGDVEVVKRAEDKANAKEFFNIVQGTPAAEKILTFLIQRFFPDQADEWILALTGPDKNAIIMELVNVLTGLMKDIGNALPPDQRAALTNIIATASSVAAPPNDQGILGQPGQGQASQSPAGNEGVQAS